MSKIEQWISGLVNAMHAKGEDKKTIAHTIETVTNALMIATDYPNEMAHEHIKRVKETEKLQLDLIDDLDKSKLKTDYDKGQLMEDEVISTYRNYLDTTYEKGRIKLQQAAWDNHITKKLEMERLLEPYLIKKAEINSLTERNKEVVLSKTVQNVAMIDQIAANYDYIPFTDHFAPKTKNPIKQSETGKDYDLSTSVTDKNKSTEEIIDAISRYDSKEYGGYLNKVLLACNNMVRNIISIEESTPGYQESLKRIAETNVEKHGQNTYKENGRSKMRDVPEKNEFNPEGEEKESDDSISL